MKILYHHRTLGDGAEGIHVREMVKAFKALGHNVKVVGPMGTALPESSRKSRFLESLKRLMPAALYEVCEIAYSAYSFVNIIREIQTFKPDFIYDRYITFNAGTVLAGKAYRILVCLEVNAPLAFERSNEQDESLIFRKIAFSTERWVCTHADHTIVVSTPLKEYLESIGVPKEKCRVMPNGVDPERFYPRPKNPELLDKLGIPKDRFIIGFSGVLRAWHGLDLLLEAVAKMVMKGSKVVLLIVGDGPYREALESIVSGYRLENFVRITGRIRFERIPEYISLFDAAVSPKATFYASPMKVIEYMALAKPVAVPRAPNFLDIIDEGLNGIAFEDGNPLALEEAICLLSESPDYCQKLGFEARKKVEKRLNWRWNAEEVCRLIAALNAHEK